MSQSTLFQPEPNVRWWLTESRQIHFRIAEPGRYHLNDIAKAIALEMDRDWQDVANALISGEPIMEVA